MPFTDLERSHFLHQSPGLLGADFHDCGDFVSSQNFHEGCSLFCVLMMGGEPDRGTYLSPSERAFSLASSEIGAIPLRCPE
jgi:hypothetical protein